MIFVNAFEFKSSFFEWLDFRFQPCCFPNPVDLWINGENLLEIVTKTLYPDIKTENDNPYKKLLPFSAEVYRENLLSSNENVPLFSILCGNEPANSLFIDIKFENSKVIWKNWRYVRNRLKSLPDLVFDRKTYEATLKNIEKFVKRRVKEITAYRPIDDALWVFIEAKNFSINLDSMNRYRRVKVDSPFLNLDVDEYGEIVFCEWDLAMAEKYPSDIIEKEMDFLINECGFWVPGIYRLGNYTGNFFDINRILIDSLKEP